nr:putative capsid [Marmot picobirnavirus]
MSKTNNSNTVGDKKANKCKRRSNNWKQNKKSDRNSNSRVETSGNNNDEFTKYKGDTRDSYNDLSWYSRNSDTLKNAADISYAYPLGLPLEYDTFGAKVDDRYPNNMDVVPGVMAFDVNLTLGMSDNNQSPINLAAQSIYTYIRQKLNKNNPGYDRADVMLVVGALSNFFAMWNHAARVYRICRSFTPYNRYKPEHLIEIMGFDYNDFSKHAANFRFELNQLADMASELPIPGGIPLFTRQSWLMSNVFKDSTTEKAQMFLFKPYGYYVYSDKHSPSGGRLKFYPLSRKVTTDQYLDILRSQINAILDSTDIGNMSGDISMAYGNQVARLGHVLEEEMITPVYNETILSQISNASVLTPNEGVSEDTTDVWESWDIYQNPDTLELLCQPYIMKNVSREGVELGWVCSLPTVLNSRFDYPSAGDTMLATRLVARTQLEYIGPDPDGTDVGIWNVRIKNMATEVIIRAAVYNLTYDETTSKVIPQRLEIPGVAATNTSSGEAVASWMTNLTTFDWAPSIVTYRRVSTPPMNTSLDYVRNNVAISGILCDMNNYTILEPQTLRNLNLLATQNLLGLDY